MKAWYFDREVSELALTTQPKPEPAMGQVRVRVAACGLNFADLLMAKGTYQDTPPGSYIPGLEFSGHVEALGPNVTRPQIGQRVACFVGQGGLAEYACLPSERALPIPANMDLPQAAGFQIAYGTSHLALTRRAALQQDQTLLVLGAAGGVGLTAVELGARMGARVVAVARGAAKCQIAQDAGAHQTLDSDTADLRTAFKALGGVDVVYDPVGGPLFDPALRALEPEGRYLAIGFASGEVPQVPANLLLVKNLTVMGFYWGGYLKFAPHALAGSLTQLLQMHAAQPLKLHISHQLPFEALPQGLDLLRGRQATGKVVITLPQ